MRYITEKIGFGILERLEKIARIAIIAGKNSGPGEWFPIFNFGNDGNYGNLN